MPQPPTWAIQTNPDIAGRDGGYSAIFQGYSVWLYGDTFLANHDAEARTLISDSWSFTTTLNAQSGITGFQERLDSAGAPTMILQETPAEQAYNQAHSGNPCEQQPCGERWHFSLLRSLSILPAITDSFSTCSSTHGPAPSISRAMAVRWPYGKISRDSPNSLSSARRRRLSSRPDVRPERAKFGTAAFINNGTLYVYGCHTPNNTRDQGCRVAKVAPATVQDRSTWMFYAGNGN